MKSKIVNVNPPANFSDEDWVIFANSLSYELPILEVKTLKNIFISYSGFCLSRKGLVKESHHAYPDQYESYLAEIYSYYYKAKVNEDNLIIIDSFQTYLLIHHPWFNYYHWITEVIPRLLMVKESCSKMVLILPDYSKSVDFMMSSLEPFSFKKIFFIPKGKSLFVKKLCLPQIKPTCAYHDASVVCNIKNIYLDYVHLVKRIDINLGDRIYLSRQKASKRRITNEDQVFEVVKKFGFTIINCEDYTFFEQISIFSNANLFVSIHGAGLTNMIFMKENSSVLEMHKKITNKNDHYSLTLWYLADALGHSYYHQICDPTDYVADYYSVDFIIDVKKLEDNIQKMLH